MAQVGDDLSPASQQGYTGHVGDNTGLVYMQARFYDPVIGRFYSNDPVGFTGEIDTFNRYSYVANNPYKYTDPTGEEKLSIGVSAEIAVIGGAKVSLKTSFDTETLELSVTVSGGPRMGLAAGVVYEGGISESSSSPARNGTSSDVKVNAEASAVIVSVSKDVMSQNADGSITPSGGEEASIGVDAVKIKPSVKVGATVGVEFSGIATTSIVKDTVDAIKDVF